MNDRNRVSLHVHVEHIYNSQHCKSDGIVVGMYVYVFVGMCVQCSNCHWNT